ncbi:MAG: hypothetical protein JXA72_05915 [Bacteroidales bacterium]|nr:hypothetical protein [Bacteroidales bacterium]
MKKILINLLLVAISFAGIAQDGNLKKQTYFRVGLSSPSWKYLGIDDKSDWGDDIKRIGGLFEVGNIFMLNSMKIAPDMRLGINVDYLSVNYHKFSEDDNNLNFFYFGSKIGPSFSYSPVSKLVFDVYAKINPVWVAGSVWAYQEDLIDDDFFMGFMGIKWSVGLNVRYSLLMLGFEFNPGYAKFRYYDSEENELTDEYLGNDNDNKDTTPVPAMNFTIGISL